MPFHGLWETPLENVYLDHLQQTLFSELYTTRRMQGMFGASVIYIDQINIERTVDLCMITKKRNTHVYTETVSQGWLVQHTLLVMEMAWTDDSTSSHLRHTVVGRGWSPVTFTQVP